MHHPTPAYPKAKEAESLLDDFPALTFCGVTLRDRIAFRKASSAGQGVEELHPKDPKAIDEITRLYEIVFNEK